MNEAKATLDDNSIAVNTPKQAARFSHNHAHRKRWSAEFEAWHGMRARCRYQNHRNYKNYGARGIMVCQSWKTFVNFLSDMGSKLDPSRSLDRINSNGHYSCGKCNECKANGWPSNCRWATSEEQHSNRRNNRLITKNGRTMTAKQWADFTGISYKTVSGRINNLGWDPLKAISTPVFRSLRTPV